MPGRTAELAVTAFITLAAAIVGAFFVLGVRETVFHDHHTPPEPTARGGPAYDLTACKADLRRMEQASGLDVTWVRTKGSRPEEAADGP